MIETEALFMFVLACLAINFTPGPSILYVMTMSATRGQKAGIYAAFGLNLGILVHVLAAAFGISTILATSTTAFALVKYLGAAYLVYLGTTMILSRETNTEAHTLTSSKQNTQTFREALLVDLLNPKIALFFLAFLPQFVDPSAGSTFLQSIFLGGIFIVTGTIVNCGIAIFTSQSVQKIDLQKSRWASRWIPGTILVALGIRLATIER